MASKTKAAGSILAVKMDPPMGRQSFGPDDPRVGAYEPGKVYRVPEDLSAEKAQALIDGGGYVACERPPEPTPEQQEGDDA